METFVVIRNNGQFKHVETRSDAIKLAKQVAKRDRKTAQVLTHRTWIARCSGK